MTRLTEQNTFFNTISDWQIVPYTQQLGWMEATQENKRQHLFFLNEKIACIGHLKTFFGKTWLMLESPAIQNSQIKPSQRQQFYQFILSQGYDIVELNDNSVYDANTEIALRQAGFLRPIGSFSFQQTNIIDLTQPLQFNENWKRNLKKSNNTDLQLKEIHSPTTQDIDTMWNIYREMSCNKHLPIPFTTNFLTTLLKDPHFKLYLVENTTICESICAMIVHTSGKHAGLLYAANSSKANEICAGNWMYKNVLENLAEKGYTSFDMEKMGASTHSTQKVFLFKQGIRGKITPLNGEWQWCKHDMMLWALFLLKKYVWKRTQT